MNQFLLVFIGGGLGSVIRFLVATVVNNKLKTEFPLATFTSNILSCLILAGLTYLITEKNIYNQELKLFLIIGLCGGLSTFSTFSFETLVLLKNQNYGYALANISISIFTCLGLMYYILKKSPY